MNGRYEWTFEADVFTVWLVYEFDGQIDGRPTATVVDARCDCDRWDQNRGLEPDERYCRHLYLARRAVESDHGGNSPVPCSDSPSPFGELLRVVTADAPLESLPTVSRPEGDR